MWAGLVRIGWGWPQLRVGLPADHGPLMVSGFLGTLISLERAVALQRRWSYAGPLLAGLGGVATVVGLPHPVGAALITAGSAVMLAVFVFIVRSHPALHTVTMGAGALAWLVGNALWLAGQPFIVSVPWWIGFLVFTIAGERLELSRIRRLSLWSRRLFLAASGLMLAGLLHATFGAASGLWLGPVGIGLLAMAAWLLRYDIARRTVRQQGLPRYVALCLLSGYVWLAVSGVFWILWGGRFLAGPLYDATLHSVLLGFTFALVFGHAPIILPAILQVEFPFRPVLYAPLVLLHAGLVLRIVADLATLAVLRRWGGLLNALAVLLFIGLSAFSARKEAPAG